ncbi:hypothetical protein Q7448_11445, partial [Glaesserella parasuis]|nr:hypothetical protein [Glaesserella parasuis]
CPFCLKNNIQKYHCSIRTIQRYIEKSPKAKLIPLQQTYLNIISDVTFFGREFGVSVLIDTLSKSPLSLDFRLLFLAFIDKS